MSIILTLCLAHCLHATAWVSLSNSSLLKTCVTLPACIQHDCGSTDPDQASAKTCGLACALSPHMHAFTHACLQTCSAYTHALEPLMLVWISALDMKPMFQVSSSSYSAQAWLGGGLGFLGPPLAAPWQGKVGPGSDGQQDHWEGGG